MIVDFAYVNYNELEDSDLVPVVQPDRMDRMAWEALFHTIPQDQLEVLVCLFLGLKPAEIVDVLEYENIRRFYNVNVRLKQTYKKQKLGILGYN